MERIARHMAISINLLLGVVLQRYIGSDIEVLGADNSMKIRESVSVKYAQYPTNFNTCLNTCVTE